MTIKEMATNEIKTYLENERTRMLEENLSDYAIDFIDCKYYGDFNDDFHEFADQNTHLYYYQNQEFYDNNTTLCESAMQEYGYFDGTFLSDYMKCHTLQELICFAGRIGQYYSIVEELWDNEKEIKYTILLDLILEYLEKCEYPRLSKLERLLENAYNELDNINDYDELDSLAIDILMA